MDDPCDPYLIDAAKRSFRDVADQDYIAARACYRLGLTIQFMHLAHQAVEKYLKAILLFNRVSTLEVGHHLKKARDKIISSTKLNFSLSKESNKFLKILDRKGSNRYFEHYHEATHFHLEWLDLIVFEVRAYCYVVNYNQNICGKKICLLNHELIKIKNHKEELDEFRPLFNGYLEKIFFGKKYNIRNQLVWSNRYWKGEIVESENDNIHFVTAYPTQCLHPECFDYLCKFIKFSGNVKRMAKSMKKENQK